MVALQHGAIEEPLNGKFDLLQPSEEAQEEQSKTFFSCGLSESSNQLKRRCRRVQRFRLPHYPMEAPILVHSHRLTIVQALRQHSAMKLLVLFVLVSICAVACEKEDHSNRLLISGSEKEVQLPVNQPNTVPDVCIQDWHRLMAEAASKESNETARQEAAFRKLESLLAEISPENFGEAADFVFQHYNTSLQVALLRSMTATLGSKCTDPELLLKSIRTWPPGMSRWVCVRKLTEKLPPEALNKLVLHLSQSCLPEEMRAVMDGLRARLGYGSSVTDVEEIAKVAAHWPASVQKSLADYGIDLSAAVQENFPQSLSTGVAMLEAQPDRLAAFLSKYTLKHRGEVANWLLTDSPVSMRTPQNLIIAVQDGLDDPKKTGVLLDRLTLNDESTRAAASRALVTQWLEHNPEEASSWVRQSKSNGSRRGGAEAVIEYLKRTGDPESMQEWQQWLGTQ
jgi:cell division protein FtsL